jgi:hypothetical protein
MVTWAAVHVGDVVRGADQRGWTVTGRGRTGRWAAAGESAPFELRSDRGEVAIVRDLAAPVDLMHRADHTASAGAVGALLSVGFNIEVLEESTVDQFEAPGALPVKRDRWGRYLLPHPETGKEQAWTRVTTLARTLSDTFGLEAWGNRMVAKGLALRADLVASAAAADVDTDKGTLDGIVKQAKEAAGSSKGANLGTALHTFTERLDRGEPLSSLAAPAPLDADLAAYAAALKAAGLAVEPGGIERIVVLPELGVAGTLDRIVRLRKGGRAIKDLKTAKDVSYSWLEIAIQEACYARAPYIWDPLAGAYERMPADVDKDRGLVLHLPVGKAHAQIYGVNLIEGWRLAQLAADVRAARSGAKNLAWLVEPDDPATVALHHVSRASSREELAALWEQLNRRGLWSEEVNAAAHARMAQLQPTTALATATV